MPGATSSPVLSPVISPTESAQPDAPVNALVITQQPSNAVASGALLAQQPIVAAQVEGRTNTRYTGTVTLTVTQLTGGPTTSNVPSQACVAGVATFAGIRLTGAGTCRLTFSAPGYKPVSSLIITVS